MKTWGEKWLGQVCGKHFLIGNHNFALGLYTLQPTFTLQMMTDQHLVRKCDTSCNNYINKPMFNKSDLKNHIVDKLSMLL